MNDIRITPEEAEKMIDLLDRVHSLALVGAQYSPTGGFISPELTAEFSKTAFAAHHISKWMREYIKFNAMMKKETT